MVERLYRAWGRLMPRVHPCYAVKCNPDEGLLSVLAAMGAGFDCASEAEISQVRGRCRGDLDRLSSCLMRKYCSSAQLCMWLLHAYLLPKASLVACSPAITCILAPLCRCCRWACPPTASCTRTPASRPSRSAGPPPTASTSPPLTPRASCRRCAGGPCAGAGQPREAALWRTMAAVRGRSRLDATLEAACRSLTVLLLGPFLCRWLSSTPPAACCCASAPTTPPPAASWATRWAAGLAS